MDAVALAMRDVADAVIRPRFRSLAAGDISTKTSPTDLVTIADIESERALIPLLQAIVDVPVVGEEASAADPTLPKILKTVPAAWVVDPVDGTSNFVHGREQYAVMVAFVEEGIPIAGWILHPESGDMFAAQQGYGATLNGVALPPGAATGPAARMRGAMSVPHAPEPMRAGLAELVKDVGDINPPRYCAGFDYADLATGAVDFLVLFRAKPWDHAPGAVILRELGIRVGLLDGSDYSPTEIGGTIVAAHADAWESVRDAVRARVEDSQVGSLG